MFNRPNAKKVLFAFAIFFFATPIPAFALDGEFYTYGGFDAIVSGFQRIALIFSDSGYKALFFSVVVLAIYLGVMSTLVRAATGARANPIAWLTPIVVGTMIYFGLVIPTGAVNIYDPTTNQYQAVGGVPNGVVAVTTLLNSIERGLTEIVTTSSDPLSYTYQAGGIGYQALLQAASGNLTTSDSLMDTTLDSYIHDCVAFELQRPGTTLTVNELRQNSADFLPDFQQAASPAIYTTYYDGSNTTGTTMSCSEAWTKISAYLNNQANLSENINGICAQLNFDTSNPTSLQQCKTSIQSNLEPLGVSSGTTTADFIRQAYLAQKLFNVFRSGNTAEATNYNFLVSATGAMQTANEWLPIMKAVLTAIALGLVPFLALLIPTPLMGKAMSVMLGFFIWITAWGVTDAILHQFIMDYGANVLQGLRLHTGGGMGMDLFYFLPSETTKILAMFGTVRMSGLMIATVMTSILVKFGGSTLAHLASGLSGQVRAAGQKAAATTIDPAGRASSIKAEAYAMPTETLANLYSEIGGYGGMERSGMVSGIQGATGAWNQERIANSLKGKGALSDGSANGLTGPMGNIAAAADLGSRSFRISDQTGTTTGQVDSAGNIVHSNQIRDNNSMVTDAQGWNVATNSRDNPDGTKAGTILRRSSAGAIQSHFAENAAGQRTEHIDQVKAAGMDANFGLGYSEDAIRRAAHSMSTGTGFDKLLRKTNEDAKTSGEARSFRDSLSNNITQSADRSVENGSAFKDTSKETKDKMFTAAASIGVKPGITGKGLIEALTGGLVEITPSAEVRGMYKLQGQDGKTAEFSASEKEVNAIRQTAQENREAALSRTLQTSEGLKYASSLGFSVTGKEADSYMKEARVMEKTSTAQKMELMTAYAMDRAKRVYGSPSPENVEKVVTDMAAERVDPNKADGLNRDIQRFLKKDYDRHLDTAKTGNWVLRDSAAIRNRVEGNLGDIRHKAKPAANETEMATAHQSFQDPLRNAQGMRAPDGAQVDQHVGDRKTAIENIQAGDSGNFTTNPFGMMIDGSFNPENPKTSDPITLAGTPRFGPAPPQNEQPDQVWTGAGDPKAPIDSPNNSWNRGYRSSRDRPLVPPIKVGGESQSESSGPRIHTGVDLGGAVTDDKGPGLFTGMAGLGALAGAKLSNFGKRPDDGPETSGPQTPDGLPEDPTSYTVPADSEGLQPDRSGETDYPGPGTRTNDAMRPGVFLAGSPAALDGTTRMSAGGGDREEQVRPGPGREGERPADGHRDNVEASGAPLPEMPWYGDPVGSGETNDPGSGSPKQLSPGLMANPDQKSSQGPESRSEPSMSGSSSEGPSATKQERHGADESWGSTGRATVSGEQWFNPDFLSTHHRSGEKLQDDFKKEVNPKSMANIQKVVDLLEKLK